MAKIAIIGAGSIVFCKTLLNDMFRTEALAGSTYALMGPTRPKLDRMKAYADAVIAKNRVRAKPYVTTDRRDALKDADYVLALFQVGGIEGYKKDYEIPLKYGVDQCIGQCVGPGGVFRALRSIPVMNDVLSDMAEVCPNAIMLNYVNPMAAISIAMGKISTVSFVGI